MCAIVQDGGEWNNWQAKVLTPGSAHAGGMNTVYADGSVQFLSPELDLETFNRIVHRADGEPIAPL